MELKLVLKELWYGDVYKRQTHSYENKDGKIDGVAVAHKINKDVNSVFKTLVTQGHSKEFLVYVIPVAEELDMKKAAKAAGEKNVEMIHVKDINKITGYIRGGCSPIGMKKVFRTFVQDSALEHSTIAVSYTHLISTITPFKPILFTENE